jgi:hypothetical protein
MQPIMGTTNPDRVTGCICKASDIALSRQEWYEIYLAAGNQAALMYFRQLLASNSRDDTEQADLFLRKQVRISSSTLFDSATPTLRHFGYARLSRFRL